MRPTLNAKEIVCPDLHRVVWIFLKNALGSFSEVEIVTKEDRAESRIAQICISENLSYVCHFEHECYRFIVKKLTSSMI